MKQIGTITAHPLLNKEIRPISSWYEWLQLWQETVTIEGLLGLLHVGFTVPLKAPHYGDTRDYTRVDRIIFYLTVADGRLDVSELTKQDDIPIEYEYGADKFGNTQRLGQSGLRKILAHKAFDMLAANFFGTELVFTDNREFNWPWTDEIMQKPLFPAIQMFFRTERDCIDRLCVRNLTLRRECSHGEEKALAFLFNVSRFIWEWQEWDVCRFSSNDQDRMKRLNISMRATVNAAKPWVIEVLSCTGELERLRPKLLELDGRCVSKLKDIALRQELKDHRHPVNKDRKVASLEEACFTGSEAAWLLKAHELMKGVHKKLSEIKRVELKREEAKDKLRELTAK